MRDKVEVEDEKSYLKQPQSSQNPPSSPTHEFSFTIYTQHQHPSTHDTNTTALQPPAAMDLSPAGDIFFHGHLLPLHLPVDSPRSSTNSIDSFTLPINLLYYHSNSNSNSNSNPMSIHHHQPPHDIAVNHKYPPKSKSFSIFSIPKWKKSRSEDDEDGITKGRNNNSRSKKLKLDFGQLIKRYMMNMVRPVLWRRPNTTSFNHQSHSFSDNSSLSSRRPMERGGRQLSSSAPASMRASPATSGIINVGNSTIKIRSESSMDELHAAIQAAIAHCKQSSAMEDKNQSQN